MKKKDIQTILIVILPLLFVVLDALVMGMDAAENQNLSQGFN